MHKRKHPRGLPHLADAATGKNGKADQKVLAAGQDKWNAAIARGEYELEAVTELAVPGDPTRDVLVVVRHKLK